MSIRRYIVKRIIQLSRRISVILLRRDKDIHVRRFQVGGSRLLVDLTASEKAVHSEFFNGMWCQLFAFLIDITNFSSRSEHLISSLLKTS